MLVDLRRVVHLNLPSTQLDDALLRLSKNIYLREQLTVDRLYRFSLALYGIAMDDY